MSITMIGLDTAKSVFQVHAVDEAGKAEIRRKLRRSELIPFFEKQEACTVVMEACGAAHHWARVLTGLGHEVKLIAPEAVRPFVKKGKKNDAADAAALCEAASRPDVKFVPVKSLEQQGILALHSARSLLVKQQTMLANAMRGLATEFGLTVPQGHRQARGARGARGCGRDLAGEGTAGDRGIARALPRAGCKHRGASKRRSSLTRGRMRPRAVWRRSPASVRSPRR